MIYKPRTNLQSSIKKRNTVNIKCSSPTSTVFTNAYFVYPFCKFDKGILDLDNWNTTEFC